MIAFKWIAFTYFVEFIAILWAHKIDKESTKLTFAIVVIEKVASNSVFNLDLALKDKIHFVVFALILFRCGSIIINDLRRKQQDNRPLEKTESKE